MMRYYENSFKKHIENISSNPEKIYLLGNQYFINKKYERAKDIFSKNIDTADNLFGAAVTNRFLGYDKTAIDYYSEVIYLESKYFRSLSWAWDMLQKHREIQRGFGRLSKI